MLVLAVIVLTTILDQATKLLVCRHFDPGDSVTVIPGFFNLTYGRNTGAALGMFRDLNGPLVLLSIAILVCLAVFRRILLGDSRAHRLAAALMVGGIVGNLMDRVRHGFVVDFLDFYWKDFHFWTFNVADSCICIGVAIYVFATYLRSKPDAGTRVQAETGGKPAS